MLMIFYLLETGFDIEAAVSIATDFSDAHEEKETDDPQSYSDMDRNNNAYTIQFMEVNIDFIDSSLQNIVLDLWSNQFIDFYSLLSSTDSIEERVLNELVDTLEALDHSVLFRQLVWMLPLEFINLEDGEKIPNDPNTGLPTGLVHIGGGKSEFDGIFTGELTNPDIDENALWNVYLALKQCGSDIFGLYGSSLNGEDDQLRSLTGELTEGDSTRLFIELEEPIVNLGKDACKDIVMYLDTNRNGAEITLSGDWRSSNCKLGGLITISTED